MRVGISFSPDALQKHFEWRHSQLQTQCAVAIVRIEPVMAGLQAHASGHQDRLVTGAADLEEDPVLAFHLNFFVIEPTRQVHRAEDLQHLFAAETRLWALVLLLLPATRPNRFDWRGRDWLDWRRSCGFRLWLCNGVRSERPFGQFALGFLYES